MWEDGLNFLDKKSCQHLDWDLETLRPWDLESLGQTPYLSRGRQQSPANRDRFLVFSPLELKFEAEQV